MAVQSLLAILYQWFSYLIICGLWCMSCYGRSCVRRGLLLLIITVDVSFSWQLHFVVICLNMKMIIFLRKTKCELEKATWSFVQCIHYYYWVYAYKTFGHRLEVVFWMLWRSTLCPSYSTSLKSWDLFTKEHAFYVNSILEESHSKERIIKIMHFFLQEVLYSNIWN
jgi:hypothetical protein